MPVTQDTAATAQPADPAAAPLVEAAPPADGAAALPDSLDAPLDSVDVGVPDTALDQVLHLFDGARDLILMGGPVVAILAVLSVIALTIILAKLIQYSLNGVGRHGRAERAIGLWISGQRGEAYEMVRNHRAPVSRVLAHAMRGIGNGGASEAQVREDLERVCLETLDGLKSWLRALDAIAQVSPLLGLFGTVIGMIEAFQSLQSAGASVDPSMLAGGIWVALMTTAVGLVVAMPTSVVLSWFEARMESERVLAERAVHTILSPNGSRDAQVQAQAQGAPRHA